MFEALCVSAPVRWKLIKERAEMLLQATGRCDESCNGLLRINQLLHMRDVSACFDRKEEVRMRSDLLGPVVKLLVCWQAIKAPVDLDSRKMLCIVGEPIAHRKIGRVETLGPMRIYPS